MSTKLGKKSDKPVFSQILSLIPSGTFRKCVAKYGTDKHCSAYYTYDQLVSTMFGQLNRCLTLREISMGIDQSPEFLSDIGLRQSPAKSSMSYGNEKRNYKIFEELYQSLLVYYKTSLSQREGYKVIEEVKNYSIKIVDATIMSVALSLFTWAKYRTAKGGIKAHVSLDEKTMVPDIINISEAKVSDRRRGDDFRYEKDTIVVDDRGYFDCKLFRTRIDDQNWFVTRLKDNILYESVREIDLPAGKDEHILKDEIIYLTGKSAATIAELYKRRWLIETFFKLIKQNLQIKTFLGTSANACKSQIFIALICYLLLEVMRRTLCKVPHRFGHFVTLIRVCLTQYNRLGYVINATQITVRKARAYTKSPPNLFSKLNTEKDFEQLFIEF